MVQLNSGDELVFLVNTGLYRQCFIPNSIYTDTGHCIVCDGGFGAEYVGGDQLEHYRFIAHCNYGLEVVRFSLRAVMMKYLYVNNLAYPYELQSLYVKKVNGLKKKVLI
ncbi:Uncharacterised protein [Escherichia coli]|nr:Uncharacterised protein [Escherichia coli]